VNLDSDQLIFSIFKLFTTLITDNCSHPTEYGFEENIWYYGWSKFRYGDYSYDVSETNGWIGNSSFQHLEKLLQELTAGQVIKGFENAEILLNGASRTAALWRSI
jgi:hypothetical protein